VDFTREPVVETVITPREGCKLVVRSSKGSAQEEYFVDSVEVVSFGNAFFFRSLEKPKNFLLPVIDYEVLEVREARMVLKHVAQDRSIKIGGGKQSEGKKEKKETQKSEEEPKAEPRKRDRRRNLRKKRSKDEKGEAPPKKENKQQEKVELPQPEQEEISQRSTPPEVVRTMLNPPPLISETINRYKEDFKQAFYPVEDENPAEDAPRENTQEAPPLENTHQDASPSENTQEASPLEQEVPYQEEEVVHQKSDLWDFSEDIPK